tara:strand:+ start:422 stop:1540 length:1119 start_codon:yes stop_codon:yes gene_type:complete
MVKPKFIKVVRRVAMILLFVNSTFGLAQDNKVENPVVNAFQIGNIVISPGKTYRGNLKVPSGGDKKETFIPITVNHGNRPGPVLSLIAGIHGSEYSPILAMQELAGQIDSSQLSGTLIIVHIANMPAFVGRTVYFGPDDLKNLNRSFPGNIDGTITERIAYILTSEVIARSDYLVDIHSGDANESLRPSYSAYYGEAGGLEVVAESKRLAVAFGLETIVQFSGSYNSLDDAIYTSAQAVTRGIPAIDIESGELGNINDKFIDPIINGSLNIMQELSMINGQPALPSNPLLISERTRVYSSHDGIFYPGPKVQTGDYITAGTFLGVVTDYHGNMLETISAPSSGVLLILFGTPPVNKGDNIVVIGSVAESAKN